MLFNLYSVVAVLRVKNETRQVSGEVQTAEIPHQVPEDNRMLAEKLVRVDNLDKQSPNLKGLASI